MKKIHLFLLLFLALLIILLIIKQHSASPNQQDLLTMCTKKEQAFERLSCLKQYFQEITRKENASIAVAKAKDLQKTGVIDDCHLAAHSIGEENLRKIEDVGKAFLTCPKGCIEGCFHGVMESYIAKEGESNASFEKLPKTCNSISNDPVLRRQCIHGAGHGLLGHNSGKLSTALTSCSVFKNQEKTCQGGVLMQNMNNYFSNDEGTLRQNLQVICNEVKSSHNKLLEDCYLAIGEGLMFYTGHDLKKSQEMCELVPQEYRDVCKTAAQDELETNSRNSDF